MYCYHLCFCLSACLAVRISKKLYLGSGYIFSHKVGSTCSSVTLKDDLVPDPDRVFSILFLILSQISCTLYLLVLYIAYEK